MATSGFAFASISWLLADCIAHFLDAKGYKFGRNVILILFTLGYGKGYSYVIVD